jgi:hypothetical protein
MKSWLALFAPVVYDTVQYLCISTPSGDDEIVSENGDRMHVDFGTFVSCMHRYCAYGKSSSPSRDSHRYIHTY